jgi:DNA-directed RNA polymerase specialized sigma24 family protein
MGQLSSFDRLTLPHLDAAYNLAFWLARCGSDAQDIVQEKAEMWRQDPQGYALPSSRRPNQRKASGS